MARRASTRPSRQGSPPPVAITSPRLSASSRTTSSSSARKCASPFSANISGIERPSAAAIMSSVSTKQRPSLMARMRPTEDLPAPMKPTRITLSAISPAIVSPRPGVALPANRGGGGGAAIRAVRQPAASALGKVVVRPRLGSDADQEGDALARRHHAGVVERHADEDTGAEAEERGLRGRVPPRVAWADAVRDLDTRGDRGLTENIVGILGEALDSRRADTVEHHRQRQLAVVPETLHPLLDGRPHGADARADLLERTPQP